MKSRRTNSVVQISAPKSTPFPDEKPVVAFALEGRPDLGVVMDGKRMVALIVVNAVSDQQRDAVMNIVSHKDWRMQLTLAAAWKMQAVYSSDVFMEANKDKILPRAMWLSWLH